MSARRSKLRLRFETVGSIVAIVVGVAALFVSWDQGRVMREQQHAAVVPAIDVRGYWATGETGVRFGLHVNNSGVGPAVIHDVILLRDGEPVTGTEGLLAIFPDGADVSWASMVGRIIGSGAMVEPLTVRVTPEQLTTPKGEALLQEWLRWEVEICYCSVFDRCATSSTADTIEINLPGAQTCALAETDLFYDIGLATQPRPTPSDNDGDPQ